MNNSEILTASVAFFAASQEYVSLIRRALRDRDGRLAPSITSEKLQQIAVAKGKRDQLEAEMYAVWTSNGIE